ncbi:CopG antitoxin of type II toxin-antitoxin system [Hydrogenispora ethanolica]|uniref:CopG antitoxin of type II toxin-antitoxin system n=1 Tax=Hydrogenispora ethanolica TaxID=1082276 RepID=A0A4V2QFL2_HYDET|nr:hypothetical protein [Hydrogenispora ethanolica]TCL72347.1 CopG antitoxin of type II toxin-antitoxin system [Hydrogenispora ethanolica]
MPINTEVNKRVALSLSLDIYEIFHKYAVEEDRSDANMALKIFKLGLQEYERQKDK